jgi:RNA polymerase sigma-70 factor (ECF subfamily)
MDDLPAADPAKAFADHRELFPIVYNMLGTVSDTEDALWETRLSWAGRDLGTAGNPRAHLVRVAVNQALARQSKEAYRGPCLPEPLIIGPAASEPAVRAESVSIAVLVVLETLTPLERAVFVLHEAFAYQHPEIAAMLERGPAAIRQLAHRAREHVRAGPPRARIDRRTQQATPRW